MTSYTDRARAWLERCEPGGPEAAVASLAAEFEAVARERGIERALLRVIAFGRQRCGPGFGKLPLGVFAAVEEMLPLADTERVRAAMLDFRARLGTP